MYGVWSMVQCNMCSFWQKSKNWICLSETNLCCGFDRYRSTENEFAIFGYQTDRKAGIPNSAASATLCINMRVCVRICELCYVLAMPLSYMLYKWHSARSDQKPHCAMCVNLHTSHDDIELTPVTLICIICQWLIIAVKLKSQNSTLLPEIAMAYHYKYSKTTIESMHSQHGTDERQHQRQNENGNQIDTSIGI